MTITDDYFEYQIEYEKRYGYQTVVLIQIGKFYEIYGLDNTTDGKIGKTREITKLLDIELTMRNKKDLIKILDDPTITEEILLSHNSRKYPLMAGVNIDAIDKFLPTLINANYNVVMVDQVTEPPDPERAVTRVLSSSTYLDSKAQQASNNLVSVYIEEIKAKLMISMGSIDLSTGNSDLFETYTQTDDLKSPYDDAYRFLLSQNPCEIIFVSRNLSEETISEISTFLELDRYQTHYKTPEDLPKNIFKNSYQNQFLKKAYTEERLGLLSPVEFLDLELLPLLVISFVILLQFAYEHNEQIIKRLSKPTVIQDINQLILDYNAVNQLNIIDNYSLEYNLNSTTKFSSLLSVIQNTSTPMGRRLLKDRLLHPITDIDELRFRYDLISVLMKSENDNESKSTLHYSNFEDLLKPIRDITRLHRRMHLGTLQPSEFFTLYSSYQQINKLIELVQSDISNTEIQDLLPDPDQLNTYKTYQTTFLSKFDINKLSNIQFSNNSNSISHFFKKGVFPDIDEIQTKLEEAKTYIPNLAQKLSKIIEPFVSKRFSQSGDLVRVHSNERDGYYLLITAARFKILEKHAPKDLLKGMTIKTQTNNRKITSDLINSNSDRVVGLYEKLKKKITKKYLELIEEFSTKYQSIFIALDTFISELDVVCSSAKTATIYNYCKPTIEEISESEEISHPRSFLEAKDLRHALVERILTDENYVPNDITLNSSGIVLYGLNASGKSVTLKSVGISIILAQMGHYVPATKFTYRPFTRLMTRISGNDNMYKGQSSFAVEMIELRTILKRANSETLIIGDEICHGTEQTSGLAIVAAALITLSKLPTNFIFATHLHRLADHQEIKTLENVNHLHLKVDYNQETKLLTYNRKLQEGHGSSIYGIEVARAMDLPTEFINKALEIRRNLADIPDLFLQDRPSRYNSKIYIDNCAIEECDSLADDIHHIQFQCNSDPTGHIKHIEVHQQSNLVALCKSCHQRVHNNQIKINGYQQTSDGVNLDYIHKVKINKSKSKGQTKSR